MFGKKELVYRINSLEKDVKDLQIRMVKGLAAIDRITDLLDNMVTLNGKVDRRLEELEKRWNS